MSVSIKINSGEDHSFALEIERFPTQIHLDKPDKTLVLLLLGLFMLAGLFLAFEMGTALMLAVVPVAFAGFVLLRARRQYILTFEKDKVLVVEPGLLRDHHWQAYYTEFEGVIMRGRTAKSKAIDITYQIIELQHSETEKTLPLFVKKTRKKPTTRWQAYADLFGVPAKRGRK